MKWFADNSELNGIKEAEIPDILLMGGIAVPASIEHDLRSKIESIKGQYADPRAPIKWNMRDLNSLYTSIDKHDLYTQLLKSSREWRREIFTALSKYDIIIIIACIEAYSTDRSKIKEIKQELSGHSFSNGLMRFGLLVRDMEPNHAQVILDWPDRNISTPFDEEYGSAYSYGCTKNRSAYYLSGKLADLLFMDSVTFTNMHYSTHLQVADLVVGATREVIECCLGKKESGQGVDCAQIVRDRFYGAPKKIVGHGISISTGNKSFRQAVNENLYGLLYSE